MKWTTANVKNSNYKSAHEFFVGTHTGSFKKLTPASDNENPFAQVNLQDVAKLQKDSRITTLAYGDATNSEILIGRGGCTVEAFSLNSQKVEHTYNFVASPVVGLARYEDRLIGGLANGQIQIIQVDDTAEEEAEGKTPTLLKAGDDMSHLRQCPTQRQLIATGGNGRQNNLKIFDLESGGKQIFTSKNLPNDFLQLEVPVWDSDVGFIDQNLLATCSRHGYVRFYDIRKQRRPVQLFSTEEQMSFTTLVAHGNYIYSGTSTGSLRAFDVRRMKTYVHTYKGFTGGLSDLSLDNSGKYLASACLDRYVRMHDVNSTVLLYQCYIKSKATQVLVRDVCDNNMDQENGPEMAKIASDNKSNSVRKENSKPALAEDKEYEELFDNMPTITENDTGETIEEEDRKAVKKNSNASKKRKHATKASKTKKTKN